MYSLNLAYKQKTKKITLPKTINQQDLMALISSSFRLQQKVIGLTNSKGQLITIDQIQRKQTNYEKEILYLITTQDMNEDNMSFASDHAEGKKVQSGKDKRQNNFVDQRPDIPSKLQGYYKGVIGDLDLFEEMFLEENELNVVFCFVKEKPKNFTFPYYLYHTSRNSAIIYQGEARVCEFFIEQMSKIPKQISVFVQSLAGRQAKQQPLKPFSKIKTQQGSKLNKNQQQSQKLFSNEDKDEQLNNEAHFEQEDKFDNLDNEQDELQQEESEEEQLPQADNNNNSQQAQQQESSSPLRNQQQQIQASLLENLLKLKDDGDITELQFYRMKSELLENFSDFMRKYQMGTRKGLRKYKNQPREQSREDKEQQNKKKSSRNKPNNNNQKRQKPQQKQYKQEKEEKYIQQNGRASQPKPIPREAYSQEQRRNKKYEIPIIVRKYNNVIQKVSTSYPLTQEQEQSINLILELQLKGLISEKQSGIYKSSILQQDQDVLPLFLDYFDNLIDQLELVSRVKKIKKINSEKKERSQHNMRLLIKYSRQQSYELLRNLLIDNNHLVLAAFEKFKADKNVEKLALRLQKIASVYRQKGQLEEQVYE